jgi:hypothetical protein
LVLESIKTGDTNRAKENLRLIAKAKLLGNENKETSILRALDDGVSPGLPPSSSSHFSAIPSFTPERTVFATSQNLTKRIACLVASNIQSVARFYSKSSQASKNLTPEEAIALSQVGIKIVAIYEDRAGEEDFSAAAGNANAFAAIDLAKRTGQPNGSAIFFAVDFDASKMTIETAIIPYFKAIRDVFQTLPFDQRYRVGVYGSGSVIASLRVAGLIEYAWIANSIGWNGTRDVQGSQAWDLLQLAPMPNEYCAEFSRSLIRLGAEVDKFAFSVGR